MTEKRVLRVRWNEFPVDGKLACRVVQQSHRGHAFTPSGNCFCAQDGQEIHSNHYPDFYNVAPHFYVRGDEEDKNDNVFLVPTGRISAIKAAIAEYNTTDGEGYVAREEKRTSAIDGLEQSLAALNKATLAMSDKRHVEAHERIGFMKPWNTVIGVDPSSGEGQYIFMHDPDIIESRAQEIAAEKIAEIKKEIEGLRERASLNFQGRDSEQRVEAYSNALRKFENQETPAPDKADVLIEELEERERYWNPNSGYFPQSDLESQGIAAGFRWSITRTKKMFGK